MPWKRQENFPQELRVSEFISLGINEEERDRRKQAVSYRPEFVQFGEFLTSERRLNAEELKAMSSSANIFGKYDLSTHRSLSERENFNDWKGMSAPEIDQMEESLGKTTMFRWILKGFYLHCEKNMIQLPPALDIFKKGSAVHLQDIAEFIELLY